MKRSTLARRAVAVAGVSVLALTGCGGGSDDAAEPAENAGGSTSGGGAAASPSSTATAGVADCEPETPPEATGDGVLTIGSVLPQTGNLAQLGPPEFAGIEVAVAEINENGGYNGQDVAYIEGDSGDAQTDIASQTASRLISGGADAIIGAASSGVSFTILDQITGAGVLQLSPANTSPDLTCAEDSGLFFRTAPSDVLQGRVMGELLLEDGFVDVATMAIDDAYGTGLAANVEATLADGGGGFAGDGAIFYNPAAPNFSAEVSQLAESEPEAILLIGFDESQRIIPELIAQGIGPNDVPLYLVDGNILDYGSGGLPEGAMVGAKATLPGSAATGDFAERLAVQDPSLGTNTSYAGESYDGVILSALAAAAAGDDSGASIASQMVAVSRDGTKCSTYAECLSLIQSGEDVDYDGVSGPVEFSDLGDPTQASVGIYEYGQDNNYTNLDFIQGSLD